MNLIKINTSNNCEIAVAACRYYKKFVATSLQFCNDIFEKFLTLVISTVVPIAKLNLKISEECINLLNFLIVENSNLLYNTIGKLDPFPIEEKFEAIRELYIKIKYGNDTFTLEQEIVHFLNAGNLMDVGCRSEGLKHLKLQLSNKKTELIKLYARLHHIRGFSEECQESILHQLICMLVKLTTSSDQVISLEAARCLGELGPADLTTTVLKPEKNIINGVKNPFELIAGQTITLLSKYIVDPDVHVMIIATKALVAVLSSKEGKLVTHSHYQPDFGCGPLNMDYIRPFLSLSQSKTEVKWAINEQLFSALIDNSEVWCPTLSTLHSDWIKGLVCSILQTFPKQNFLTQLIPICKMKVSYYFFNIRYPKKLHLKST